MEQNDNKATGVGTVAQPDKGEAFRQWQQHPLHKTASVLGHFDAGWMAAKAAYGVPVPSRPDLRELVIASNRACIDWAQADPEDVQQKFDAMNEARDALFAALGVALPDGGQHGL